MNDLVRSPFLPPSSEMLIFVRSISRPSFPLIAATEAFKNRLTLQPALQSKETAAASYGNSPRSLQSQFEAQTVQLREIYKVQRPKNTARVYESKQEEWEVWYAGLEGNMNGAWVAEDKLCLFLEQQVVNRDSWVSG